MIRVANIIEEGKLGGPQVRMVRVAAALKGKVETIIILPHENSRSFQALCNKTGIDFVALPISRITKEWRVALRYVFLFPYEIWRITRVLKQRKFDLVHVSGGSWQYKAVIAAWLAGIPSVWHLNDTSMPGWVRRLFRLVQPLARGFVFASHRSQDYYDELVAPGRPQLVVPSTVDTSHFDPALDYPDDLDVPSDVPVIGTVVNVNPIKGLEVLIRAAARLREMGHTPHVIVVGAIPKRQRRYHQRLVALAEELGLKRLHFIGARADVRPLLARFDVYVCSSVAESSPVSVWEAMAMGKPVVSTDVGDVARHIQDGKEGFIVPVGDDKSLANRIRMLLSDSALRNTMGRQARKAVSAFAPATIANRTLDIYKQTIRYAIQQKKEAPQNDECKNS